MKTIRKNDMGVSPVIAVILMVAITVVLAGVVFLWAQSFTEDAGGGADTISVDLRLTEDGVPGTTLYVTPLRGDIDWTKYQVIFNNNDVTIGVPTSPTETGIEASIDVTDAAALNIGDEYNVKMIKIADQSVVLNTNVVCEAA